MTADNVGASRKAKPPEKSGDATLDDGNPGAQPEAAEPGVDTVLGLDIPPALTSFLERLIYVSRFLKPITEPAGKFLSTLGDAIWAARVPCVASGALLLLMAVPDQTTEAVRTMIEGGYVFTFIVWWFLATFVAMVIAIYSKAALDTCPSLTAFAKWTVFLLVTAAPLVAPFFPVIASWSAHGEFAGGLGLVVFLICMVLSIPVSIAVATEGFFGNQATGKPESLTPERLWLFRTAGRILTIALSFIVALIVVMLGSMGNANWELPAVILVYGWAMLLLGVLATGVGIGEALRFPFVMTCVALALLWSLLDWNDNHVLPNVRRAAGETNVADAFLTWVGSRKDAVSDQPYPLVIVAAEGGGLRAAYMTALVLEELRLRCPRFQHHLFSVIGVSGGSVGAALTSASASDNALLQDQQRMACAAEQAATWRSEHSPAVMAAGADLLRPLLRGLLVADLPMRFFPSSGVAAAVRYLGLPGLASSMEGWFALWSNRATYLERGIDLAWRESRASEQVPKPDPKPGFELRTRMFYDMWPGADGRDLPALILLSTDVAGGRRVAISHLRFGPQSDSKNGKSNVGSELPPQRPTPADCMSPGPSLQPRAQDEARLLTLGDIAPGLNLSLPAAAVVSASFPLMTPAATVPCRGERWRLVDGGYFENSGLTTAFDLIEAIGQAAAQARPERKIRIILVRIENGHATTGPSTEAGNGRQSDWQYFPELGSPVRTFLGTRDARAALARRTADRANEAKAICYQPGLCIPLKQVVIELRWCHTAIPLGWSLSEGAKREIRDQVLGTAGEHPVGIACPKRPNGGGWPDQLRPVIASLDN